MIHIFFFFIYFRLDFHYVIFDEAHMLKNMATSRYENLMRVQASRKLLLTGKCVLLNYNQIEELFVYVKNERCYFYFYDPFPQKKSRKFIQNITEIFFRNVKRVQNTVFSNFSKENIKINFIKCNHL